MVRGRFSWFQVVFSWFFVVPGHLKGQLDPPIGTNGGWLDPPVGNVTFLHQMMVGYLWFHVGFHGSRLVIFGSMWVFMVFHGSMLVFHGFSWFQVGFSWFFSKMYPMELYPGPTIQSRSAARRAA